MTPYSEDLPFKWSDLKLIGLVVLALALLLGGIFASGYAIGQRRVETRAIQAETEANVARGEANALKAQAEEDGKIIDAATTAKDKADAEAGRLRAKLASLKPVSNSGSAPVFVGPVEPVPDPGAASSDLLNRIAVQSELIQAQEAQIKTRDELIEALKRTVKLRDDIIAAQDREIAGVRIALEAQKSLTKGALWKGRIQGLAVGVAAGYIGGRAH